MPLAVPSHLGFVAPLWLKWPRRFSGTALCVGAVMPDVIDGLAALGRGHLGQWYGHSLVGALCLCLPLGILMTWLASRHLMPMVSRVSVSRHLPSVLRRGACYFGCDRFLGSEAEARSCRNLGRLSGSVLVGSVSHLLFDLPTHEGMLWFYPWVERMRLLPGWWYTEWGRLRVPGYVEPYPIAFHTLMWCLLSMGKGVTSCRLHVGGFAHS